MTSQTKPKICHVSYSRLRHMHDGETCNCRRGRERAYKMASGPNIDSKFRDSHITGKYPSFEDGAMKANTLMSPRHTGEERRVSQCSGHVYRWICYYGSSKMRSSPFNHDYYRIIVSYLYRDNFDLSYRLSIENRIWHIVTALLISHRNQSSVSKHSTAMSRWHLPANVTQTNWKCNKQKVR